MYLSNPEWHTIAILDLDASQQRSLRRCLVSRLPRVFSVSSDRDIVVALTHVTGNGTMSHPHRQQPKRLSLGKASTFQLEQLFISHQLLHALTRQIRQLQRRFIPCSVPEKGGGPLPKRYCPF